MTKSPPAPPQPLVALPPPRIKATLLGFPFEALTACPQEPHQPPLLGLPQVHEHVPALSKPHTFVHVSSGSPPPPGKPPLELQFKLMLSGETPHQFPQCSASPHHSSVTLEFTILTVSLPCCPVRQSCRGPHSAGPSRAPHLSGSPRVSLYEGPTILAHSRCPKNTN